MTLLAKTSLATSKKCSDIISRRQTQKFSSIIKQISPDQKRKKTIDRAIKDERFLVKENETEKSPAENPNNFSLKINAVQHDHDVSPTRLESREYDALLQRRIQKFQLLQAEQATFVIRDGQFKDTQFHLKRQRQKVKLISKSPTEYCQRMLRSHKSELKEQLSNKGLDLISFDII